MLHSLEAFVGVVDFDLLKHHCTVENGMMASPAATSAYLMYVKEWDTRAETYLSRLVRCSGDSAGGVPAAFPTCNFELSWVSGHTISIINSNRSEQVANINRDC